MAKYLVIYHAPAEAMAAMANITPEEAAEGIKPWMAWMEKCGTALVDGGSPLGNGHHVKPADVSKSNGTTSGYSILEADNMDAALGLVKDHPHLAWTDGCALEVFEMIPMEMPA